MGAELEGSHGDKTCASHEPRKTGGAAKYRWRDAPAIAEQEHGRRGQRLRVGRALSWRAPRWKDLGRRQDMGKSRSRKIKRGGDVPMA